MKLLFVLLTFLTVLNAHKKIFIIALLIQMENRFQRRQSRHKDGFDILENIKYLARNDKIDEAFAQIKELKEKNKLKILKSDSYFILRIGFEKNI